MTTDPDPPESTMFFGPRTDKLKHDRKSRSCIIVGIAFLGLGFISNILEMYFHVQTTGAVKVASAETLQLSYLVAAGVGSFSVWMSLLMLFQGVIHVRRGLQLSTDK